MIVGEPVQDVVSVGLSEGAPIKLSGDDVVLHEVFSFVGWWEDGDLEVGGSSDAPDLSAASASAAS